MKKNYDYDYVMDAIDTIIGSFEKDSPIGNVVCRTKISPASTEDDRIILNIEKEIKSFLNVLNLQSNVEILSGSNSNMVLCISFFYKGLLGTYNTFIYNY